MSSSFTGFSEDEIQKLKNGKVQVVPKETRQTAVLKPQKRVHLSSNERSKVLNEKLERTPAEPVLASAKLHKLNPESHSSTVPLAVAATNTEDILKDKLHEPVSSTNNVPTTTGAAVTNAEVISEDTNTADKKIKDLSFELKKDLSEFEAKRKLMEEQNRKRKELLAKALATKTKQTQAETQRLNEINAEFKRLDNLLSNDVKYLRKQIDFASLEYNEAQKRYLRIEKEFLEAKLAMHQKLERKELLTEHLYAIIEKNEERKAEKLNELLAKLNLKPDSEEGKEVNSGSNNS